MAKRNPDGSHKTRKSGAGGKKNRKKTWLEDGDIRAQETHMMIRGACKKAVTPGPISKVQGVPITPMPVPVTDDKKSLKQIGVCVYGGGWDRTEQERCLHAKGVNVIPGPTPEFAEAYARV